MTRIPTNVKRLLIGAGLIAGGVFTSPASAADDQSEVMELTAVIRDFRAYDEQGGHPDFQRWTGSTRVGLVEDELGRDGKPVLKTTKGQKVLREYKDSSGRNINPALYAAFRGDQRGILSTQRDDRITSAESFASWYNDEPGVNMSRTVTLELVRKPGKEVFVLDSSGHEPWRSLGGFFPIDDQLFGNYGGWGHNYHFTTEISTSFQYKRGQGYVFKFTGDDDVWVFIGDRLVIDLGSLHSVREQFIDLDRLNWLQNGQNYELKIFHAERRTSGSNFRIETTLPLIPAEPPSTTAAYD